MFMKRRFCSLSCANTRTDLTKHGYSWRARKHLKKKCEACGYARALQAHHIDQDKAHNEPENIQTLCKHCHDFWHTTAKAYWQDGRWGCHASRSSWGGPSVD